MKLSTKVAELTELLTPAVEACGVVLWGIEFMPQGRKSLLRLYIENQNVFDLLKDGACRDKNSHVTIEECALVNHQVSGLLEVHDPIAGEYVLEVSSPGFDRPIFSPKQLALFIGKIVNLRLIYAITDHMGNSCRKIQGKLYHSDDSHAVVMVDGKPLTVAFDNIDKANLIYS